MPFKSAGDVILGYRLVSEPQMSGQSKWAFAEKGGKTYFIKQFLSPVQPSTGEPGSSATYKKKKLAAEKFEKRHAKLNDIGSKGRISDNLVVPIKVGWVDGKYTKISVKVNAIDVRVEDLIKQSIEKRAMIMLQLSEALRSLHQLSIVHSDIKWTNVLFERTKDGVKPRLIDFDAGYSIEDRPLDPDDLTFDAPYAAPEVWKFTRSGAARDGCMIGLHSDIFSLGVLFHEIACGKKPLGDKVTPYGQHLLTFAPAFHLNNKSKFYDIVSKMLQFDIEKRPPIQEIVDNLSELLGLAIPPAPITSTASAGPWGIGLEKPASGATYEASIIHPTPVVDPEPTTTGIKGVLARTFGWMWGRPRSPDTLALSGDVSPKVEPVVSLAPLPDATKSVDDSVSRVKASSSFASKEVEKISGDRVKMTFANRPEREVKSIIKKSARVKVSEESKVKTTIRG